MWVQSGKDCGKETNHAFSGRTDNIREQGRLGEELQKEDQYRKFHGWTLRGAEGGPGRGTAVYMKEGWLTRREVISVYCCTWELASRFADMDFSILILKSLSNAVSLSRVVVGSMDGQCIPMGHIIGKVLFQPEMP